MPDNCDCGHCRRERARALGFGDGPYTGSQWARIAVTRGPAEEEAGKSPPGLATLRRRLLEAQKEAAKAEEAFEEAGIRWAGARRRVADAEARWAATVGNVVSFEGWDDGGTVTGLRMAREAEERARETREAAAEALAATRARVANLEATVTHVRRGGNVPAGLR